MKVLLIKTSSLGDLIHCMPAVNDLAQHRPDIELHWLVEEAFIGIPGWHPFVKKSFAYAQRRWRKSYFSRQTRHEIRQLKKQLINEQYDAVIDAQGLLKSALAARWLKAPKYGYDKHSIREPLAANFYNKKFKCSLQQTAISRNKQLLAWAFDYTATSSVSFGLKIIQPNNMLLPTEPYAIFLHGTNWESKVWPTSRWVDSAQFLISQGVKVFIPWSNEAEKLRAEDIAKSSGAQVLDKMSLHCLSYLLQHAKIVIGCDTGLSHITAALATPTLALYGASNSELTGLVGNNVLSLQSSKSCSPCMKSVCPLTNNQSDIPCYQIEDIPNINNILEQGLSGVPLSIDHYV